MKKIFWGFAALICLLASCQSDKSADAADLIATVPSDASLVATLNLSQVLEKAGCKIDGSKIEPSKAIKEAMQKNSDSKSRAFMEAVYQGNSGIDPSVAVVFQEGYDTYITGIVANPATFKAEIEKNKEAKFTETDGLAFCKNVAVSANQFWVNLSNHDINADEIRRFKSLDAAQSFAANPYAEKLNQITTDMEGWANIGGLLNTAGLGFQERAQTQVALQTLFEDPSAITFSMESSKGEMTLTAEMLDSKGKTAKFQLPLEGLDTKTLASIGGTADVLVGISLPAKLMERIRKEASDKAPSMVGVALASLACIDGTAGFATDQDFSALKGVITTDGQNVTALTSLLALGNIQAVKNGNLLEISNVKPGKEITGKYQVSQLASDLKGAVAGFAGSLPDRNNELGGMSMILAVMANGNSVRLKAELKVPDTKVNFLQWVVEQEASKK